MASLLKEPPPYEQTVRPLSLLWCLYLSPQYGLNHGGTLRYANLSRELLSLGHRVHFVVPLRPGDDPYEHRRFLAQLADAGCISSYALLEPYLRPKWLGRVASLLIHPRASDFVMRRWQRERIQAVLEEAGQVSADGVVFSDRDALPLLAPLASRYYTVADWCDSGLLFALRGLRVAFSEHAWGQIASLLKSASDAALHECLLAGIAQVNLYVSPVDKRFIERFNRQSARNRVLYNGVDFPDEPARPKVPGRLVFSGTMDFEPNYEAAIWFIDRVLPLVRARRADVKFIVAGANPGPNLTSRVGEGVEVTGYVDDLRAVIGSAQLYVAPMVSGSGFKNKVVEALSCNSYVAATPMAVEFLPEEMRELLLVAEEPGELAARILDFLSAPEAYDEKLRHARNFARAQFTWKAAAATIARWFAEGKPDSPHTAIPPRVPRETAGNRMMA